MPQVDYGMLPPEAFPLTVEIADALTSVPLWRAELPGPRAVDVPDFGVARLEVTLRLADGSVAKVQAERAEDGGMRSIGLVVEPEAPTGQG